MYKSKICLNNKFFFIILWIVRHVVLSLEIFPLLNMKCDETGCSMHAKVSWYLLLLDLEGLHLCRRNKDFFWGGDFKSGCKCERVILIHFLVWSEEVMLIF